MINIITPCSRVSNLQRIADSLTKSKYPIKWHIVADMDETELPLYTTVDTEVIFCPSKNLGLSGNPQRNRALGNITEGYVYFLDDDNILHPDLLTTIALDYYHAFYFHQANRDGSIRLKASPDSVLKGVGYVDTAQFLLPADMVLNERWDNFDYCADGHFFGAVYRKFTHRFLCVNKVLSYYNFLR